MNGKPHKGSITDWRREEVPDKGLGWRVRGYFVDHPEFGGYSGCTSYVVAHDAATGEIETRNSRYTLVGPENHPARLPRREGQRMSEDSEFRTKLRELINVTSRENGSDTPDFILAEYLGDCLDAFDKAVGARTRWYAADDPPAAALDPAP